MSAVLELKGGGYMVASKSVPGAWRMVFGRECSCPAGKARTCRHRRLVAAFCAEQDRKYERPLAAVNPSIFVD